MIRISSNSTMFWKLFVPIFYATFFGLLGMVIVFEWGVGFSFFSSIYIKISYVLMFLSLLGFMYFTIMSIKRIDAKENSFIVTNYFKAYQYMVEDIESYHTYDFFILKLHSIHLKAKGKFGRKIRFIPYEIGIDVLKDQYPEWAAKMNAND